MASARAISSRLRPGVPSDVRRRLGEPVRPTRSSTARALASASAAMRMAQEGADHDVLENRHVLEGQRHLKGARRCRAAHALRATMRVMSRALEEHACRRSATRSPVRQLKKVDLPAPLGPIRPRMSPCSTAMEASSTALKAAERLGDVAASSSMGAPRRLRSSGASCARQDCLSTVRMPPGWKRAISTMMRAIDDEGQAGAFAAEQVVGDLLQRHQDQGADQRPEQQCRRRRAPP